MKKYRIADWDRRFETTRSRAMTRCAFVSVPLLLAERGYMRLMKKPDAEACFGVYVALAVWQMGRFDGRTRDGWLTEDGTEDGHPLTADDLAVELRMSELAVSVALDELSSRDVGLLEAHALADAGDEREAGRGTIGGRTEGETEGETERKGEMDDADARPRPPASTRPAPERRTDGRRLQQPPAGAGTVLLPAVAGNDGADAQTDAEASEHPYGRRQKTERTRTEDGQREAAVSAPLNGGGEKEQQQHPSSLLFSACAVEIPCQDGAWTAPDTLVRRWLAAYSGVDVTAQLLRMAAWAYAKLEAGGSAFYDAWTVDGAPARATQWLAEEQQKADEWKARGNDPQELPKRRGAAGAPEGDWRREVESLDKLARGKRKRMADLDTKCNFFGDTDSRTRWPTQWQEYRDLKAEVDGIVADMAKVKRSGQAQKGGGRGGR